MSLRLGVLVAALSLGACACGIPTEDHARRVGGDRLPADLRSSAQPSPLEPVASGPTRPVAVYYVHGETLEMVTRILTETVGIGDIVASLLAGPAPAEQARGLRSAISPETAIITGTITDGEATID